MTAHLRLYTGTLPIFARAVALLVAVSSHAGAQESGGAVAARTVRGNHTADTTTTTDATTAWTRVSYLSGAMVYLEAGTNAGLREGSRLAVIRGGTVVGELVVTYISSSRAACTRQTAEAQAEIGDSVRFAPARLATSTTTLTGAMTPTSMRATSGGSIRGRLGLRYLLLNPTAGVALAQPGIDARLDGQRLGGSAIGIALDVRAQRSTFTRPGTSTQSPDEQTTRVYQAVLQYTPDHSPLRLALGRQFPQALSSVGMFDGAALDLDGQRWSSGAFAGQQPDPVSLGLSSLSRQYGAYLQLHNTRDETRPWSLTLGGVGSYAGGQIDREYAFARITYNGPKLSIYATQELDFNRGWKGTQEHASTTPTSSFLTAQFTVTDALSLYGGLDNRRNVRLYRDFLNPEIIFDDSFREGMWGGGALSLFGVLRLSSDVRRSTGGNTAATQSVTSSASLTRLTRAQIGMHVRMTTYEGPASTGRLQSASLETTPFGALHVMYSAGVRESSTPLSSTGASRVTWTSTDADIGIGRSLYLMLSTYAESGTLDRSRQTYASISYRF